ncbi:hypothetical protein BW727_100074 [Jeotgalibaca dankookensis]|uniref:AraC effector-binding domain-containing protein n=1 Tax=Jeotgalibaca dankookensis TaxID=708126 RepID=A0A1S6ILR0_9LACT|nr:GyrI-like domain-containing protein [Jeotgalibaca dankookensis]AQS52484.1 hypothetical protein BW727_100074 [Jeotgalibaca dankookensis]
MPRISDWQIVKRPSVPSLSITSTVALKDLNKEIRNQKEKLSQYLNAQHIYPADHFYVRYHSFSKTSVDLEAGFPLFQAVEGQALIESKEKEAGLYLTCLFQGPHKKIPPVYREMEDWLVENHYQTNGQSEEIYLNEKVLDELLVTQILIPISEVVNGKRK